MLCIPAIWSVSLKKQQLLNKLFYFFNLQYSFTCNCKGVVELIKLIQPSWTVLRRDERAVLRAGSQTFQSSQWSILWRYLSGLFSPSLLSPELLLTGLSEVPAGPWLSVSTSVAPVPLPVFPVELCRCGSGLPCAPCSESLSSTGSFPWLPGKLSPILNNINSFVEHNMHTKWLKCHYD